jgi:hypothetical protein
LPPIPASIVSVANNTVNTQGRPPATPKNRTSIFISNIIQPGETLPMSVAGNTFYVTVATAELQIRPSNGAFNGYSVGTGLDLDLSNSFEKIEVRNDNAFAVVFQIFVGFDRYIDKRLYLDTTNLPLVTIPTYSTPSTAAAVQITDKSAQVVTDINGQEWYAISRQSIVIANTDAGVTLLVQQFGSVVANGPAIGAVPPLTSWQLATSGDYTLHLGGAMINAIVAEVYQCLIKDT